MKFTNDIDWGKRICQNIPSKEKRDYQFDFGIFSITS